MTQAAKKTIGELEFELAPMPVWAANKAFHRFMAMAGPGIGPLLASAAKGDADKIVAGLLAAVPAAFARADPDELQKFQRELLETCLVKTPQGKLVKLLEVAESLLAGKAPVLMRLSLWAGEVNLKPFFTELLEELKDRFGTLRAPSSSTSSPSSPSSGIPVSS